jgi:hypothetical protein
VVGYAHDIPLLILLERSGGMFAFYHNATLPGTDWALVTPYWFWIVVLVIIAVMPWLPWRFGLRTFLIATTLVAVGLGETLIANNDEISQAANHVVGFVRHRVRAADCDVGAESLASRWSRLQTSAKVGCLVGIFQWAIAM